MKLFSILLVSFLLINCGESQSWGTGIKAEGNSVTKSMDLDKFTGVVSSVSGQVYIKEGSQKFEVTAAQNVIDVLELDVKDGVLYIGFEKSVRNVKELVFNISIPSVHHLGMTGSGKMKVTGFDQQESLMMKMTGSGSIHSDNGAKEIEARLSGSGGLYISGNANNGVFKLSGSGGIHARDLNISDVEARLTGSGGIDVACKGSIDATITGSGSIDVYGNPRIKSRVTGSGRVREHR